MSNTTTPTPAKDPFQITVRGRMSYPHLHQPQKPKKGQENNADGPKAPKFGVQIICDKETDKEDIAKVKSGIKALCEKQWPGKTVQLSTGQKIVTGTNAEKVILKGICLHDGTERDDQEGYGDGVMYISTSSTRKPQIKTKQAGGLVDLPESSGKPYGGCYAAHVIRLWAQDNDFGKRINCEIAAVCFVKDGKPFGSAPVNVEESFADVEESEPAGAAGPETEPESEDW